VEAWAPVRVKDAFEFHGQCNSTHSVRYALARNGGPVNRWRHAVNVHLMQARERKQSLKSVLDSKLSPRWPEATHLLYTYYTPYGHTNVRGGVDSFAGVVSFSLTGPGPRVPPYAPSWVRQAAMALRYEPVKRHAVGLWINNCGPRRAGLADLLLGSGLRVESYGRCRHNTSEGQAYWAKAGRLHEANFNPNLDESYPALRACRRHRLILAEENELCPGYYTWDLINAIKLCGAIPIIFTAGGLPDYGAEVGPFPSVNASRRGWLREVQRIMRDDAYYRAKLEHFVGECSGPSVRNARATWILAPGTWCIPSWLTMTRRAGWRLPSGRRSRPWACFQTGTTIGTRHHTWRPLATSAKSLPSATLARTPFPLLAQTDRSVCRPWNIKLAVGSAAFCSEYVMYPGSSVRPRTAGSPQPKGARDPVTHVRRGVVNPASLVCGRAHADE
jgi:hypothetical protein